MPKRFCGLIAYWYPRRRRGACPRETRAHDTDARCKRRDSARAGGTAGHDERTQGDWRWKCRRRLLERAGFVRLLCKKDGDATTGAPPTRGLDAANRLTQALGHAGRIAGATQRLSRSSSARSPSPDAEGRCALTAPGACSSGRGLRRELRASWLRNRPLPRRSSSRGGAF